MGVTEVTYSDPFTGEYEITIVRDTDYTVKVESPTTNYSTYTESFTTADPAETRNFELFVPVACNTAGYGVSGASANFDDELLPAGWSIADYRGSGQVWQFINPGNRFNFTGGSGGFATVNSWLYEEGVQDTGLRTPVMDFSATESVSLEFDTYFQPYPDQIALVRYSTDGGTTWTILENVSESDHVWEPYHYSFNLDDELAGQSQAMIEFRFQASWAMFWQIDNVSFGDPSCEIRDGGVVAGYVVDANDVDVKLLDANVRTALVSDTTTARADDGGNGLYWFFQPTTATSEEVEFTISKSDFVTTVEIEEVEQSVINHIDFKLGAGHLVAIP